MQFNCHVEKYKSGDVGGIRAEQFRLYTDQDKYKNRIQHEQTENNVYNEYRPWFAAIKAAKERQQELTGKKVRADAVVLCSAVQSVPESWPREAALDYFRANEQFMKTFLEQHGLDPDAALSAVTHYDEQPPHQTFCWMPLREGRFQAKQLLNRQTLRELQKEGYQHYQEWAARHPDLEKIEPYREDSGRKHLSELDYKKQLLENQIEQEEKTLSEARERLQEAVRDRKSIESRTIALKDEIEALGRSKSVSREELADLKEEIANLQDTEKLLEQTTAPAMRAWKRELMELTTVPIMPEFKETKASHKTVDDFEKVPFSKDTYKVPKKELSELLESQSKLQQIESFVLRWAERLQSFIEEKLQILEERVRSLGRRSLSERLEALEKDRQLNEYEKLEKNFPGTFEKMRNKLDPPRYQDRDEPQEELHQSRGKGRSR